MWGTAPAIPNLGTRWSWPTSHAGDFNPRKTVAGSYWIRCYMGLKASLGALVKGQISFPAGNRKRFFGFSSLCSQNTRYIYVPSATRTLFSHTGWWNCGVINTIPLFVVDEVTRVIPEGRWITLDPLHLVRRKCRCVIPEDGVLGLLTIPLQPMEEMPLFI